VFLLGLTAHSLITVLARAFYALQDTKTPVVAALLAVVANIVLANLLVAPLGLNGLAAAIAISAWMETVALVVLLVRRVPGVGPGMAHVWMVMGKTVVVSLAGALAAYGVDQALTAAWGVAPGFLLLLLRISLAVVAGGLVIIAGSLALRIDELRSIVGVMTDLVRRRGRA
jgi:putative peptidoglycan lipid II flippase